MTDKPAKGVIPRTTAEQIDRNLKRVYQDLVEQEIPDRFRALLDDLRRREAAPEPAPPPIAEPAPADIVSSDGATVPSRGDPIVVVPVIAGSPDPASAELASGAPQQDVAG